MLEGRPSGIVVCNVPTDTLGNGHRTRVSAGLHVCDPRAARRPGVGAALPAERAAWLDEAQEASSGIPGAVPPPRRRQLSRPRADPRLRLRSGSHRRQLDRHRAVRRPHVIHRFHVLSGAGTWYRRGPCASDCGDAGLDSPEPFTTQSARSLKDPEDSRRVAFYDYGPVCVRKSLAGYLGRNSQLAGHGSLTEIPHN